MSRRHDAKLIPISSHEQWLELRLKTVGASESAALFDSLTNESPNDDDPDFDFQDAEDGEPASPYSSPLALWALKKGKIKAARKPNERIGWGTRFEPVIAQGIAESRGWLLRKANFYCVHPAIACMGASLDYEVDTGSGEWEPLEIKNVDADEKWKWRNAAQEWIVPPHIQIQVQHQLAVTGAERAFIGVLFGGSAARVFECLQDNLLIHEIEAAVQEFWSFVESDVQPQPNLPRDEWVIKRLYQHADPAKLLDWSANDDAKRLIAEWKAHNAEANAHKKIAKDLISRIALMAADAIACDLGDGTMFSAKTIEGGEVSYTRDTRRDYRVVKQNKKHSGRPVAQLLERDAA